MWLNSKLKWGELGGELFIIIFLSLNVIKQLKVFLFVYLFLIGAPVHKTF